MNDLLTLIGGWAGFLERGPILLQLAVVIAPLLLLRVVRLRLPARSWVRRWPQASNLLLIAVGTGLLALLDIRTGLAIFLGSVVGWWYLIDLLRRLLERRMNLAVLHQLDSNILRPLFILVAAKMTIDKLVNLEELAVVPLGAWFGKTVTLGQLGSSLLGLYLLLVGSGPLAQLLSWLFSRLMNLTPGSSRATTLLLRYTIVGLGLIWALDHSGFDHTAILAIAGGLSVGLGFGVKEAVSNFISGLWLLIEGFVRPGEVLEINGDACEVRSLGLRAAMVWRDRDNTELLIPNQILFGTTTTTFTGSDGMRRCQVAIAAAYRHRPQDVMRLMVQTTLDVPGVLGRQPVVGLVLSYAESGVDYAVRFWIADPMQGGTLMSDVRAALWDAFSRENIEIPYPQRVLHLARDRDELQPFADSVATAASRAPTSGPGD